MRVYADTAKNLLALHGFILALQSILSTIGSGVAVFIKTSLSGFEFAAAVRDFGCQLWECKYRACNGLLESFRF